MFYAARISIQTGVVLLCLLVTLTLVWADTVIFNDKNVFLTTTNANSATGPLPLISRTTAPITVGSVTFTLGPRARDFILMDWSARLPGNELAISAIEDLNIDLAAPVFALGFDFVEPKNDPYVGATFVDSTFTVSIFNNGVFVDSFTFNAPEDVAYFVAVSSDTAFNRVEIRETIGGIENEFFGQVYTSTTTISNKPLANAGIDQTVYVGTTVTLDGSGSSDPNGDLLTYNWAFISKPGGSLATLSDSTLVNPTFTVDNAGTYVVSLTVNDGELNSDPDTVTISIINVDPIAHAGLDQAVTNIGTTVQLDGTQSYDPDGDPITYQWTFISIPDGSTASLTGANTATPTFIADKYGEYVVQLVVNDGSVTSLPDTVTISFTNIKPVANAGTSGSAIVGEEVTLDGSGSTDANGDYLTYQWSFLSIPEGSLSVIDSSTAMITTFVPDKAGTYVIQLVVHDGTVTSDPSTIQIQVIHRQTVAIQAIQNCAGIIASLDTSVFKNANMQNTLINKLNAVIANIEAGNYVDALGQLRNDILGKTDGCADSGSPDKNDWIKDCAAQGSVYPYIQHAIMVVEGLIAAN